MNRTIEGFHQDDDGDWVAELDCLHGQHVRHKPPLWPRPWAQTEEGRAERIGAELDCPLCDRAELPDGLVEARTAGPFDQDTLPPALRRDHLVAAHTWGLLRVLEGELDLVFGTRVHLRTGDEHAIPPTVPHHVDLDGPVRLELVFLVAP